MALTDFIVVVKKETTHQRANHVSHITNGESPTSILRDLLDASLFQIEMVPKWNEWVVHFLTTTKVEELGKSCQEKVDIILACSKFKMVARHFQMEDGVLCLVAYLEDHKQIMFANHVF